LCVHDVRRPGAESLPQTPEKGTLENLLFSFFDTNLPTFLKRLLGNLADFFLSSKKTIKKGHNEMKF